MPLAILETNAIDNATQIRVAFSALPLGALQQALALTEPVFSFRSTTVMAEFVSKS